MLGGSVAALMLTFVCGASARAATTSVTYLPFAADGTTPAGLGVVTASGGSCDTASFAVVGALRCAAGATVRDPCWIDLARTSPQQTVVVCAADPWVRTVVRLRLMAAPPSPLDPVAVPDRPWALRMASGRRCVYVTGAAARLRDADHARANYDCGHGRVLFGVPDRRSATWRIRSAQTAGGRGLRKAAIATAYF
jgi:hypothetical protein